MYTWTQERNGRTVTHAYDVFTVTKGAASYIVRKAGAMMDGTASVQPTLAKAKAWVEAEYQDRRTVADCVKRFEDEPMYECVIPGAQGRVTRGGADVTPAEPVPFLHESSAACKAFSGKEATIEFAAAPRGVDPKDIPASEWRKMGVVSLGGVEHDVSAPNLDILGFDHAAFVRGFTGRCLSVGLHIQLLGRGLRRGHKVRRYNAWSLGIDQHKVIRIASVNSIEAADGMMRQDERVCLIEQELLQYDGKRRTPNRDKKVKKLRRILRTLKRGIYE